jgi:hypothetical protein
VCVCDKKKFLILDFLNKFSPLNAIMRKKNLYFGFMKIHTHDFFIKAQ